MASATARLVDQERLIKTNKAPRRGVMGTFEITDEGVRNLRAAANLLWNVLLEYELTPEGQQLPTSENQASSTEIEKASPTGGNVTPLPLSKHANRS